jgi:predicted enzyme related to lactoylglutathione lyase
MKDTICWADIPVTDLDRSIAFYSAVTAGAVAKLPGEAGTEFGLLPGSDSGVSGCLYVAKDNGSSPKGPLVYLSVEGRLDAATQAVTQNGGRILEGKRQIGPHGFRVLIADSEGNRLALHSMKP